MKIASGRYVGVEPPFQDGDIVEGGNYTQFAPSTAICKAVENLTITGGNFTNCIPQRSWTVTGGNWCQIDFCTNERPELIGAGMTPCVARCGHLGVSEEWVRVNIEEVRAVVRREGKAPEKINTLRRVDRKDADGLTTKIRWEQLKKPYRSIITKRGSQVVSGRATDAD